MKHDRECASRNAYTNGDPLGPCDCDAIPLSRVERKLDWLIGHIVNPRNSPETVFDADSPAFPDWPKTYTKRAETLRSLLEHLNAPDAG